MLRKSVFLAGILCSFCLVCSSWAVVRTWDGGGGDGKWSTPANWSNNTLPGSGDNAQILMGSQTVSYNTTQNIQLGQIDGAGDNESVLNFQSGTLTVNGGHYRLANGPGTKGKIYMTGGTINHTAAYSLVVGNNGDGILHMDAGVINLLTYYQHGPNLWIASGLGPDMSGTGLVNLWGGTINARDIGIGQANASGLNGGKIGLLDIRNDGKLVLTGDWTNPSDGGNGEKLAGYIDGVPGYNGGDPVLVAYGGAGVVDVSYSSGTGKTTVQTLAVPTVATEPQPGDGDPEVKRSLSSISWKPGEGAILHDVYFGTNYDNVNDANIAYPLGVYKDSVEPNNFTLTETLVFGQLYWWRIDERYPGDVTVKGNLWSFTVDTGVAENPSPTHEAQDVAFDAVLSWTPEDGALSHDVYLSTDLADANEGIVPTATTALSSYDPCGVFDWNQTYYWRVDENYIDVTIRGNVWSFTVGSSLAENPIPEDGGINIAVDAVLSWTAAEGAVSHDVYLSTDFADANEGTVPTATVDVSSYDPCDPFDWDQTYYWRVDVSYGGPKVRGNVWSFTTWPVYEQVDPRLSQLRVLDESQVPQVHWFRKSSQSARETITYASWHNLFSTLMGIQGKGLVEEVCANYAQVRDYFTQFKSEHPEQIVLLHFNGNARDPSFEREPFFAGHWLYFNGATITADVPIANSGDTTVISVSDTSLFKTGGPDEIGLCELDGQGKPNWHVSEQVKLISIGTGTITVSRGGFGTSPRAFVGGNAYAAAHPVEGPWGPSCSNLMWRYNHSTLAPADSSGRQLGQVLAEQIAGWYARDGQLGAYDGIEFDVLFHARNTTEGNRGIDTNADGIKDDGEFNGIQTYGVGVVNFLKHLRSRLGNDRLILADGCRWYHQRGFGILNGMESEMFPTGGDVSFDDWAGGINRLMFWAQNSHEPAFRYIARPESEGCEWARLRLVLAAAALTGAGVAPHQSCIPTAESGDPIGVWDEVRKGTAWELGWLGQALGPPERLALRAPDQLVGYSLEDNILPVNGIVDLNDGTISLSPEPGQTEAMRFQLRDVPCDGSDMFISATVSGSSMTGYPDEMARLMYVAVSGAEVEPVIGVNIVPNITWVNSEPFTAGFYFKTISTNPTTFTFYIESPEPVTISNLTAHAAPDVMIRKFDHGLVLANPAPHSVIVDLTDVWPCGSFHRLQGSSHQDTTTNNGQAVGDTISLSSLEGLFLVRDGDGGPPCWDCPQFCCGDSDGDDFVNNDDWPSFRDSYQKVYPDPRYNPCGDYDMDGDIDNDDWPAFRDNYQSAPSCTCSAGTWPPL